MANVTPAPYRITAADAVLAATGLAVALAMAWISLDLLAGGRLTLAVSGRRLPAPLRVVKEDDGDEADTGTGR